MVQSELRYVGFWLRVVASLIDAVLMNIAVAVLSEAVLRVGGFSVSMDQVNLMASEGSLDPSLLQNLLIGLVVATVISLVVLVLFDGIMPATVLMATPGKWMLGMAITDEQGQRISYGKAIGRHAAKGISGLILCIGFLMVAFTKRKRGLHDMMAKTIVVERSSLKSDKSSPDVIENKA